jgi:DNA-directed RNA polymerase specialized sigma24 family protein
VADSTHDDAWAVVVTLEREAGQRLYGYALHLGIDTARASDLVQEALLRLWREIAQGTVVGSPEAWAYRTLSRLAMDEHRHECRFAGFGRRSGLPTLASVAPSVRRRAAASGR